MFGRYRLLGRLAIGGMAEVWAAQLLATGGFVKPMVIKRVLPELASNPSFLRMLMAEARVAAKLSHGNVCAVFELGAVNGEYYLAMEYLRGASLTQLVRAGGAMSPALAAAILVQVCDGLHYAHEQRDSQGRLLGLVHRDVSPHNLFVTVDGVVKVLDFGIAKVDDGSMGDRTEAGKVKGKLPYMSPEQLAAEALDRRSDVWSLGAVLFELLTGKRLFNGPGPGATVDAIRNARVPTLASMGVHAPAFDDVLARALCKSPQWRFGAAAELRRAIVEAVQPDSLAASDELTELVWARCGAQVRAHDRLFDVDDPDPMVVDRLPLRAEPSSLLALPDVVTEPTRDALFVGDGSSSDLIVVERVDTRAGTEDDSGPAPDRVATGETRVEPVSGRVIAAPVPAPMVEATPTPTPASSAIDDGVEARAVPLAGARRGRAWLAVAVALVAGAVVAVVWWLREPAPRRIAGAGAAVAATEETAGPLPSPVPARAPAPLPSPVPAPAPVSPSLTPKPAAPPAARRRRGRRPPSPRRRRRQSSRRRTVADADPDAGCPRRAAPREAQPGG